MSTELTQLEKENLEDFNIKESEIDMIKEIDEFFDKYLNHESLKEDKFIDLEF